MANWDVFHGDRLKLERDLTTFAVREGLARGTLLATDLVRPAGTAAPWVRLAEIPELVESASSSPTPPQPNAPTEVETRPAAKSSAGAPTEPEGFEPQAKNAGPNVVPPPAQRAPVRTPNRPVPRSETDDVSFPVITDAPTPPIQALPDTKARLGFPPVSRKHADAGKHDQEHDQEQLAADFVEPRENGGEIVDVDVVEILEDEADAAADAGFPVAAARVEKTVSSRNGSAVISSGTLPVRGSNPWDQAGALAEVPDEEEFSLSRSGPLTIEELDLAPMVDVAFQLVLFFMVAAQTVLYKTLEIPKPTTEQAPAAVAQGRSRTLDDLKEDYILVEIDSSGAMKLDRQPVAADMTTLVERLRSARETTHRKAMLLSADFATPHRSAVLAYDAANEIGLGIVIAKPTAPAGPAPSLRPVPSVPQADANAGGTPASLSN